MKQEDKELLLQDLCARLPYGVRGKVKADGVDTSRYDIDGFPLEITFDVDVELLRIDTGNDEIFVSTFDDNEDLENYIEECQTDETPWTIEEFTPYLRPMSSMTEEEKKEFSAFGFEVIDHINANRDECPKYQVIEVSNFSVITKVTDWLNTHHFDYRGLIEKGLALEALDNMYK